MQKIPFTAEQEAEIKNLQARYQEAVSIHNEKIAHYTVAKEKLDTLNRTIAAIENEAREARENSKSLIRSLIFETKQLLNAKSKEQAAYNLVEDYQEIRTELVTALEIQSFALEKARNSVATLRLKTAHEIGKIIFRVAIDELHKNNGFSLLRTALELTHNDTNANPVQALSYSVISTHDKKYIDYDYFKDFLKKVGNELSSSEPLINDCFLELIPPIQNQYATPNLSIVATNKRCAELGIVY
ncbi:hypothetical protein [Deefgea sp. CFH1-16]|uniref:hypothetical protein n=1 Tax=Deefgea sp. CFH1-16 TaxID=2675457 RepID=UPI0015F6D9CF|nr:hypothetical protein [Deefgea sp. CFH1-16]MBM5575593.1 hypothetical protein [Deefgea sp. CFH1-16]